MGGLGRMLIGIGLVLVVLGLVVSILPGRLPGDFVFRGKNTTFYFPLATSLLLSLVLSLVLWLLNRR
jgi:hypothetical protein